MPELLVVMTTLGVDSAAGFAEKVIGERLAACVQILPPMTSVYVWKGEVQHDTECLLLIKTPAENYKRLETFINAEHPYETPEIIAVAAEKVSKGYLSWANETAGS